VTRRAPAITAALCLLTVTGSAVVSSCATTYDTTLASEQASTSTSSSLPTGTAADLLPRLVTEASGLSGLMMAGMDAGGSAQRIQELWDAVKDEVNRQRPDLLSDFSANVARCVRAVQFSRAADADKAAKNLVALADAYLAP
jgi:hypothetical protein